MRVLMHVEWHEGFSHEVDEEIRVVQVYIKPWDPKDVTIVKTYGRFRSWIFDLFGSYEFEAKYEFGDRGRFKFLADLRAKRISVPLHKARGVVNVKTDR